MRLLIAACLAPSLILLAPLASPHLRSALAVPVGRWASHQMAPVLADPNATPVDESSIVLHQGESRIVKDTGGDTVLIVSLGPGAYRLLPAMLIPAATDTLDVPQPTATPWPGMAAMPTADPNYAPSAYGNR